MKNPRVLVACEESQAVTIEFRRLGIAAWSCDLDPCSGGCPHWHLQQDVREVLHREWDLILAFPPCTHLSVSGSRYFKQKQADGRQQAAIEFFMLFANAKAKRIAIENPVGIMSSNWRKPDQIIQPWMFGDDASKATCLWLKGLPLLTPTKMVPGRLVGHRTSGMPIYRWENQCDSGQNKLGPHPERARNRAKTYPGIAKAMAEQWGRTL